ncbi:MAG: NUDIX domain-containing protein [Defluviitaleaceae bacterium]|nr:NUDIX domain-containing protein [Defluviitaleaceae bacterium]
MENHFTATGIVFNRKGEILMIKHKKLGVWLPPGGHVHENELPNVAALREIFEETGITAQIVTAADHEPTLIELPLPMEILFFEDIEGDGLHNLIDLVYLCRAENCETKSQEIEVDAVGWFSVAEILELEIFENTRNSVQKASRLWDKKALT